MSLFQSCCLFDLSCVVRLTPKVDFSPLLPGYLRDLYAMQGSLVGLVFSTWLGSFPGGAPGLQATLQECPGMPPLRVYALLEDNPMDSLRDLRRWLSLDLSRCFIYLSPLVGTRLEAFAQEAGLERRRVLDVLFAQ